MKNPVFVSLAGNALMAVTFLFVGPLPCLKIEPSKGLIYGMKTLAGVGNGLGMVSTFKRAQDAAVDLGFVDDQPTYHKISGLISNLHGVAANAARVFKCQLYFSGLWSSAVFLGSFSGPTFGGILVEQFGFPQSTLYFFLLAVIAGAMNMAALVYKTVSPSRYQPVP